MDGQEIYLLQEKDIKVYPNPTTGIVYINKFADIQVYDNIGRLVLSGKGTMINLFSFDKGIYNTVIKYNNQTITKKIIKN